MVAAGYKEKLIPDVAKPVEIDELSLKSQTSDENYTIYEFPIKSSEINQQKYLAIVLYIIKASDFKSFYVGPES